MKKILSLILAALVLTGCARNAPPTETMSPADFTLAEAVYPEMAPYPNEMEFVDPKTGIFNDEGFSVVHDAWRSNRDLRADIIFQCKFRDQAFTSPCRNIFHIKHIGIQCNTLTRDLFPRFIFQG